MDHGEVRDRDDVGGRARRLHAVVDQHRDRALGGRYRRESADRLRAPVEALGVLLPPPDFRWRFPPGLGARNRDGDQDPLPRRGRMGAGLVLDGGGVRHRARHRVRTEAHLPVRRALDHLHGAGDRDRLAHRRLQHRHARRRRQHAGRDPELRPHQPRRGIHVPPFLRRGSCSPARAAWATCSTPTTCATRTSAWARGFPCS